MYFTQIPKDGEVLVPVPEFTFEDYLDFFGKIRCEQEHHAKCCLREIKV